MTLAITDLHVTIEGKEILNGITLEVKQGEIVALMGPNGSGKSTLANAIMGHPSYEITKGSITYEGKELTELKPEERAKLGLFLSFQQPTEIPGLIVSDYLREIVQQHTEKRIPLMQFRKQLKEHMEQLGINPSFSQRYLNQGFSGGEKKRMEILQLALLKPKMAVLDETDSGLDIDALKSVAEGVQATKQPDTGILVITHYRRMLDYLKPDRVLIIIDGRIAHEDGPELIDKLEAEGYQWMKE